MDVQRAILVFALAFVLILVYQRWLEEQQSPDPVSTEPATAGAPTTSARDVPAAPDVGRKDVPPAPGGSPAAAPVQAASGQRVQVLTDLLRVQIEISGGGLHLVELRKYPVSVEQPDQPFALLREEGTDIFTAHSGLIGKGREFPNHRTTYRTEETKLELKEGQDSVSLKLLWDAPDGVKYSKVYTFTRNSYEVKIDYLVDNQSDTTWTGFLYAQFLRTPVAQDRGFFMDVVPSYLGGAIYTPQDKFEKVDFSDMSEKPLSRVVDAGWVAMLQHYFVGAWFPRQPGPFQLYSRALNEPTGPRFNLGFNTMSPVDVAAGATGRIGANLFVGPKEQKRLEKQAEGFVLTVDYGWLTPISAPLFWVLERIHAIVGNWGWAIVILTCLIKLAFFPLSAASYKSMAKMKKLQPRLQTLKERYGDDKAKLNQAMMELYKKDKVNPLGGCLPIVVQIPVFIALYWVLLESVELRQADFMLWINDLSVKDPYFVLPILMGATMLAQQMLNPSPLDPMQKKIMMALPIVFTALFLYFPAGLVLYWLVNNVLSIAQQWYINRTVAAKT
jgi:YidC/Oxa1 family membrane protein insertase